MKLNRALMLATLAVSASFAHAADPKATIADLDGRLGKIGAPRVEGTDTVAGKAVPALFFGERKINNNFDVVDGIRKSHQATATVFVKEGDEFVRVSTNVLTPEGKRGALLALYAFNAEIASVRDRVREALPGEVRLQWWREALDEIYTGKTVRAQPTAQALSRASADAAC